MTTTDLDGVLACEHGRQRRKCEVCQLIETEKKLERAEALCGEWLRAVREFMNCGDGTEAEQKALNWLNELRLGNGYADAPPSIVETLVKRAEKAEARARELEEQNDDLRRDTLMNNPVQDAPPSRSPPMTKYSYSHDDEHFHGEYDTPEEAFAMSNEDSAYVGENVAPTQPEDFWRAYDWLEHVSCQDEYSMDAAEGWDDSTKEQLSELETEVRKVMAAWLDRHGLRPKFWIVENVKRYPLETNETANG